MANVYGGSTRYSSVTAWAALTTLAVGAICRQSATPTVGNERCFRVSAITTGITGASEPSWTLTANGTTSDAGVTWTECTGQAIYNGDGGGSAYAAPHARLANAYAFASAGDNIYFDSNHAATQSGTITLSDPGTAASPVKVFSVDGSVSPPTALLAGASETSTGGGITFQEGSNNQSSFYVNGFTFIVSGTSASNITFAAAGDLRVHEVFDNCLFNLSTTSGSALYAFSSTGAALVEFFNSKFRFGNTGQSINFASTRVPINWVNCIFADTGSVPGTLFTGGYHTTGAVWRVIGCDLSAITGSLLQPINDQFQGWGFLSLENCKLAGGVSPLNGSSGGVMGYQLRMHNCDSAATNYRLYDSNYLATVQHETTVVRTGGATNGTTPISWSVVSSANTSFANPFRCSPSFGEEIEAWVDSSGSSLTATTYLITNTTLNNNDVWMEVEYLGASGNPQSSFVSTRMAWFGTPAALTSDSSTWGGAISNKYKITATFTPQMKGTVRVRFYVAKPSVTIYFDPYVTISGQTSGRQYMSPGAVFINEGSSGGAAGGLLINPGMGGGIRG